MHQCLLISRRMDPEEHSAGPDEADAGLTGRRLRRALARRFPRSRWLYNWVRVQMPHYARQALRSLHPRSSFSTLRWLAKWTHYFRDRRRESRLTVGIEITAFWEPLTGVGWYLYRLLEALAERDDVVVRLYGPTVVASPDLVEPQVPIPSGKALHRVLHEVPEDLFLPRGAVIRLMRRLEPLLIAADSNNVLFGPNYFLPRRFRLAQAARVVTVHDLGFRTVPWTLREETLRELTGKLEHSIFEADQVVTVSAAIKSEMAQFGYAEPDRVTVVHHGPGHLSEVSAGELPQEAPRHFALHVGTLEPRKNILMLLDAWRQLRRNLPEAPDLVFCGRFGWKAESIQREMGRARREGWVHHLGYVSEEELAALYAKASLVVFPSLYEGFGLPAVEAFWAGTPLVCSSIAALREVAGDAALYAPADRPDLFAEQVEQLLGSQEIRARLKAAGRERARHLSWRVAGEKTLGVWRKAAGRPALGENRS